MPYYVNREGRQYGPYTSTELVQMAREGRFSPVDLIWMDDLKVWKPADEVIGHISPPAPGPPEPVAAPAAEVSPPAPEPAPVAPAPASPPASLSVGGYAPSGAPVRPTAGPVPPGMHWALVLLLAVLTRGIFPLVWIFVEAGFVRKIDPKSNAILMLVLYFVMLLVGLGISVAAIVSTPQDQTLALVGAVITPACAVFFLIAIFGMRSSLERYYNTVENIRLKLSGLMTFFFSVYYFQHHFKRIADWKHTGRLQPQH